ncbi:unnamed protein product [Blepharisma stoltei]|uniref:Folate receptor-like domain-containing protein n=1 Tax=Blepharisma stoltei TaxID=1481888 RepID=A0AAU9JSD0_9CILI|nr:unnamed protein product [Blepharisma stoltei]
MNKFYLLIIGVWSLCQNSTSFRFSPGTQVHTEKLPFCQQHSQRTCCNISHSLQIFRRISRPLMNPPLYTDYQGYSARCLTVMQDILCSECDGDVGEGHKSGICQNLCDSLYESCKDDYFEAGMTESGIEFCSGGSWICYPLTSFVDNGKDFCERLGFEVKKKNCFDGISAASVKGKAPAENQEKGDAIGTYILIAGCAIFMISFIIIAFKLGKRQKVDIRRKRLEALIKNQ